MSEEVSLKEFFNQKIDGLERSLLLILNPIKEQTTKTNGRVTKLEEWRDEVGTSLKGMIQDKADNLKREKDLKWSLASKVVVGIIIFAGMGVIQYLASSAALDKVVEYKLKTMSFTAEPVEQKK